MGNISRKAWRCRSPGKQKGAALIIVALLSALIASLAPIESLISRSELRVATNDRLSKEASQAAEAGLTHALHLIRKDRSIDALLRNAGTGDINTGLFQLGGVVNLNGVSYRFVQSGLADTDGYYVRISDDNDDNDQQTNSNSRIYLESVGRAGHGRRTAKVSLRGVPAPSYTIWVKRNLSMSGSGTSIESYSGDVYSTTTAEKKAKVAVGGNLSLGGGATIYGVAKVTGTTTTTGDSTVTEGTTAGPLPPPPMDAPSACKPPLVLPIGIQFSNSSYTYNPLNGDLNVSGGNTVTFKPGVYCLGSFKVEGKSTMVITGRTAITINGSLDTVGGVVVNQTGISENLVFNVLGDGASMAGGTYTYARVNAPNANVSISGGTAFHGYVVASTLTISGGVKLRQESNDGKLSAIELVPGSWREAAL